MTDVHEHSSDHGRPRPTLRALRESAGMTQMELAVRAGVSLGTIGLLERHKQIPTLQTYVKLKQVLGPEVEQIEWTAAHSMAESRRRRKSAGVH